MRPIQEPTTERRIDVDATPDALWRIVSDVRRIPEWSPVCHRCEWVDGPGAPAVGTRFRGHNKLNGVRWVRECVVTEAEPGRVFAFSTSFKGEESTRWRYRFDPAGSGGATVHEAYEVVSVPPWIRFLRRLPGVAAKSERDTERNITTSLERLKAVAERDRRS